MPAPASLPRASLETLLASLFDADGLRRHLKLGPEGEAITAELPERAALRELIHATIDVLIRRGLVDVAFFDRLQSAFPRRVQDIRPVCGRWIAARPRGEDCPPILTESSPNNYLIGQIEEAYQRREDLIVTGADCTEIDREIVRLRREIRCGPQLSAGESLLGGRYRLVEVLGSGGFAMVWKAYDREMRNFVALKVLHGQWNADRSYRERFIRGARTMAHLHHPNIVRVLREPCDEAGFLFYVMNLVDGECLHRAMLGGHMGIKDAIRTLISICDALAFAHERGYVHRDVKPANILLDRTGQAQLSDFDLIRGNDTTGGTRTGAGIGSLYFAAPEALSDASRVDARADVYSMGMTLLFAALGRGLRLDDLYDVQMGALSTPATLSPSIYRATARHIDDRFASITEFKATLLIALASWPDPSDAVEESTLHVFSDWLEYYNHETDFEETIIVAPYGRSLVATTRPSEEVRSDALVHFEVCEDGSEPTRTTIPEANAMPSTGTSDASASVPTVDIALTRTSGGPADVSVSCFIGHGLADAELMSYQRLALRIVDMCARAAVSMKASSLTIPTPFHRSERFSSGAGIQALLVATVRTLREKTAPDTIRVCIVPKELVGDGRAHTPPPPPKDVIPTVPSHSDGPMIRRKQQACLVVIYGAELGRKYHIGEHEMMIGRSADNAICLGQDEASRHHAILRIEDDRVKVRDNDSTNGTYVNDVKIREAWLKTGDVLKIGRSILKFISGDNVESLYHEEIHRIATLDELTHLFNKRYFLETLQREISRARRSDRPLALCVIDIDHFAQCNSLHGHRTGDYILGALANILREHGRKVDGVARIGNDEFAMILPELSEHEVALLAEKLRLLTAATQFSFEGREVVVTISIGAAELIPADATYEDLLRRAEQRLRRAKETGRDRIVADDGTADAFAE